MKIINQCLDYNNDVMILSSDDDSVSYQQNFKAETIVDSGATINVITNKVEQINSTTVKSGMVVPTTNCPDMTDDELKRDKRKVNSKILNVNSFQAIAPLLAHEKGVHFFGGIFPSKIDPKDFY
jgi:hypothetical protein